MAIVPILRAYRDYATQYASIDAMISDMRADVYLPLIPRARLARFARIARDRAVRMES
jgi:hypothetical protein